MNKKTDIKNCILIGLIAGVIMGLLTGCKIPVQNEGACFSQQHPYEAVEPTSEALSFIKLVANTMGISDTYQVIGAKFTKGSPIAMAGICNGQRTIIYDAENHLWFEKSSTSWKSLGVLIHEIGHLSNNDSEILKISKKSWDKELGADYLAGFTIARLGGTILEAASFTDMLNEEGSDSHPPRTKRRDIAMSGWLKAQEYRKWESNQCYRHDWYGEVFTLDYKQCRIVNLCNAGKVTPRITCKELDDRWILQD